MESNLSRQIDKLKEQLQTCEACGRARRKDLQAIRDQIELFKKVDAGYFDSHNWRSPRAPDLSTSGEK